MDNLSKSHPHDGFTPPQSMSSPSMLSGNGAQGSTYLYNPMAQRMMGYQYAPRDAFNNGPYMSFGPMGTYMNQTMGTDSYSQLLQSERGPALVSPSSHSAFSLTGSHSSGMNTIGSGSSRKNPCSVDDDSVSSPQKKTKTSSGKIKGVMNKVWPMEHDDCLIPFLAEQARQGNKADKTFKCTAFTQAATYINGLFGSSYTQHNVRNHMKCLARRLKDVKGCFEISGAGWCDEKMMITLDPEVYKTWATANHKLKDYVNKPLPWYDDLCLIIGDDAAKGEFKKTVYQPFGNHTPDTDIEHGELPETPLTTQSVPYEIPIPMGPSGDTLPPNAATATPSPPLIDKGKRGKKTLSGNAEIMKEMVETVKEVAKSIRESHEHVAQSIKDSHAHWLSEVTKCVYEHKEYPEVVLDALLEDLSAMKDVADYLYPSLKQLGSVSLKSSL